MAQFLQERENGTAVLCSVYPSLPLLSLLRRGLAAGFPLEVFVRACITVTTITTAYTLEQGPD